MSTLYHAYNDCSLTGPELSYSAAENHSDRTIQPDLLLSGQLSRQNSTLAGHTGYTGYLTPTPSGVNVDVTMTGNQHAHSGVYPYIAYHPSVTSMVSPGTHPAFLSRQYTSMQYSTQPTMGGTLHLQPLMDYHNPVISTSPPTNTTQQQLTPLPPRYSALDTLSLQPQQQQATQRPPLTWPQWNT